MNGIAAGRSSTCAALAFLVVAGAVAWGQPPSRGGKNRRGPAAPTPGANVKPKAVFKRFPDWVACVAFARDGKTLAAGSYGVAKLFDVADEREAAALAQPKGFVKAVALSFHATILATGTSPATSLSGAPTPPIAH